MDTLTPIFIVLATAVLWVGTTSGMLALLSRAERPRRTSRRDQGPTKEGRR